MANRIKWHQPDEVPLCDALLITKNGKRVWRSWNSAAPGWWEQIVKQEGVKKWRKLNNVPW